MERKNQMFKSIIAYLPIVTLAIGLIVGGTTLKLQAEQTKTKAEEIAKEVEKLKDENQDLEKSVEITKINQENIKEEVKKTGEKVDKVIDLLLKMQGGK